MTAASETITSVLKDGIKRERTFLTEEDLTQEKTYKEVQIVYRAHGLWKSENFKMMTANDR